MKEIKEELKICEDYIKLQNRIKELSEKFRNKYDEFSKTDDYGESEYRLLKGILSDVIMSKMPYRSICFKPSNKEIEDIYRETRVSTDKVVFSRKGIGIKREYRTNVSYDDYSHILFKKVWKIIKENVMGVLGDNGTQLDNFFNFVDVKAGEKLLYYEKLTPDEVEKVREIIKISNKMLESEEEALKVNELYLLIHQGKVEIIQTEETEVKVLDRLQHNSYVENVLRLDEYDLENILFGCYFEDKLNLAFEKFGDLIERRLRERDERIAKIKEYYKEDLMLLKLKESNKNG